MVRYHCGLASNSHLTFECKRKKKQKTHTQYKDHSEREQKTVCVCDRWVITEWVLYLSQLPPSAPFFGVYMLYKNHVAQEVACILNFQWYLIFIWTDDVAAETMCLSAAPVLTMIIMRGHGLVAQWLSIKVVLININYPQYLCVKTQLSVCLWYMAHVGHGVLFSPCHSVLGADPCPLQIQKQGQYILETSPSVGFSGT